LDEPGTLPRETPSWLPFNVRTERPRHRTRDFRRR